MIMNAKFSLMNDDEGGGSFMVSVRWGCSLAGVFLHLKII
jgi:hypothetical protein